MLNGSPTKDSFFGLFVSVHPALWYARLSLPFPPYSCQGLDRDLVVGSRKRLVLLVSVGRKFGHTLRAQRELQFSFAQQISVFSPRSTKPKARISFKISVLLHKFKRKFCRSQNNSSRSACCPILLLLRSLNNKKKLSSFRKIAFVPLSETTFADHFAHPWCTSLCLSIWSTSKQGPLMPFQLTQKLSTII